MSKTLNFVNNPENFIRASFSTRGLFKVFPTKSSFSVDTSDVNTLLNVAHILSDVEVEKEEPTGFKSLPEFLGIDYVGYVIEKERLDKATGKWLRIDEYRIIGSSAANFKDSRVAYGHSYRYRIKSILKATIKRVKKSDEILEIAEDLKRIEQEHVKQELSLKQEILANIGNITNIGLVSKVSSGEPTTVIDIVDGLKIENTPSETIPVKVPITENIDLRLLKNLRTVDYNFTTGNVSRSQLQKITTNNAQKLQEEVFEYVSYYYESNPSRNWHYVSIVENVPPPPPSSIKIVVNTDKKEIFVSWLKPANSQRDIKYFRLYKRRKVGESWKLLGQMPENVNVYIDKDVVDVAGGVSDDKFIYALTCIDVHGIESFLSMQIQAQLNPDLAAEKKEKKLKWISGSGAKPSEVNTVFKKFLDQEKPIIAKKNIVVSPTEQLNDATKNLIIRVTSLDTHEQKEFKIILRNQNIRREVQLEE